jgi:hypothetical protein
VVTFLFDAAGAKTVCIWSLVHGFRPLGRMQVADLRGSIKAIAVAGSMLYVGGQSCQVSAYRLSPGLLAGEGGGSVPPGLASPADLRDARHSAGTACGSLRPGSGTVLGGSPLAACANAASETIRAVVGHAEPPALCSDPASAHCGAITALAACGPYVFSASSDSTLRVWKADTLECVRVLRGHRGAVLALFGGPGIVLR